VLAKTGLHKDDFFGAYAGGTRTVWGPSNGREFPLAFALAVEAAGIRHRYIQPRRPQQNGKVERSHRIDHEEFWSRHAFSDFDTASTALRAWERTYNHERFSLAL
jgi:transposase InsO family protein